MNVLRKLAVLLWVGFWVVLTVRGRSTSGNTGDDTCYISHSGCKYKVMIRAAPGGEDCSMPADDPKAAAESKSRGYRFVDVPDPGDVDLAASVKKIENLEQTLVRMMEGLSQRSLRHIRQIKADLRHMTETMNDLKVKGNHAAPGVAGTGSGAVGKKGALVCPTEFIGGGTWPSCYRFSTFNASWHEAREYCLAFGGNLVSLDTIKEAYIVDYLLKSTPEYQEAKGWWTSGNYIVRSQKWMWTARQYLRPIGFSRWAPGEPNARSTMHCLLLYKPDKYYWHDGTCTDKHSFVCEIEL